MGEETHIHESGDLRALPHWRRPLPVKQVVVHGQPCNVGKSSGRWSCSRGVCSCKLGLLMEEKETNEAALEDEEVVIQSIKDQKTDGADPQDEETHIQESGDLRALPHWLRPLPVKQVVVHGQPCNVGKRSGWWSCSKGVCSCKRGR